MTCLTNGLRMGQEERAKGIGKTYLEPWGKAKKNSETTEELRGSKRQG